MYVPRTIHGGFVGILFLVATVLLLSFHTLPTRTALKEVRESVSALERDVTGLTAERGTAQSTVIMSEVEEKKLTQSIPQGLGQDGLIADLNRITKATEVTFSALTFTLSTTTAIPTITIAAGFQGTPVNIVRFLKALETNTTRKIVVHDASLTRTESESGVEVMNLNVTLQAFYRTAT